MLVEADKHHTHTHISDDCTFWNLLFAAVVHMPHRALLDLMLCNIVVCRVPHCGRNKCLCIYGHSAEKCKGSLTGTPV